MKTNTLRPGLLVSLKTSIQGNVSYKKTDIEPDHLTADGMKKATWETQRTVTDPAEHETAIKARGKARSVITGVCSASAFGLLCPESEIENLDKAVEEAREIAANFNRQSALTKISVYVIVGRVAADDVEALRAINSEVRDLMGDMERGLKNLDAKTIRDAADKARALGKMLTPDAAARVQDAIDFARKAARKITKAGETAEIEVDAVALRRISEARTSFLDLDPAGDVATPETTGRAIDLGPDAPQITTPAVVAPQVEMF